jgi:hypothetical protein
MTCEVLNRSIPLVFELKGAAMSQSKAISLLLIVTAALPAAAQVSVSLPNGIEVQMTARMEPGSARVPSAVMTASGGRFQRVVLDGSQRRYFAYDVLVEPKDGSRAWQVRIEPFSLPATALAEMQVDPSWTRIPLLKYPFVPDVRPGETVAIDLLENPNTGQKVVDYLVFNRSNATAAERLSPLRDLSLAEVELRLENFRISINGTLLDASTRVGGSISGAALWLYLPERGRFIMSLLPNSKLGFRRAGEVTDRSLTFTEAHERYDIQSTSRIVPAGGRFNLYVLHDPDWRPTRDESNSPLIIGSADRAEWLTAK